MLSKGIPPPAPVSVPDCRTNELSATAATAEWVQQHAQVAEQSQNNMYLDQAYNYAPDYQQGAAEHGYVEGWPVTPVPPGAVVGFLYVKPLYLLELVFIYEVCFSL